MALYKHAKYLRHVTGNAFDRPKKPGEKVKFSGIYRCTGCGDEIAANKGDPLPPQNKHQHADDSTIRWRLIVCAVQN